MEGNFLIAIGAKQPSEFSKGEAQLLVYLAVLRESRRHKSTETVTRDALEVMRVLQAHLRNKQDLRKSTMSRLKYFFVSDSVTPKGACALSDFISPPFFSSSSFLLR